MARPTSFDLSSLYETLDNLVVICTCTVDTLSHTYNYLIIVYHTSQHYTTDQMELQIQAQVMWIRHHKSSLLVHSKFLGIWLMLEGFIAASLIEAQGNVGVLPAY